MAEKTPYLLRERAITLGGLFFLVPVYIIVAWIIVSSNSASLLTALEQYENMFPEFMRSSAARTMVGTGCAFAALALAAAGMKHAKGIRRGIGIFLLVFSPLAALYFLL